jgi:G3E family GTPase
MEEGVEQGEEGEEGEEGEDDEWIAPVVSRFTFLARRPFHPGRLHKLLKRGRLEGVIRSRGLIWVATHPKETVVWNQVRLHAATHPRADSYAPQACALCTRVSFFWSMCRFRRMVAPSPLTVAHLPLPCNPPLQQVGNSMCLSPGEPWLITKQDDLPVSEWPDDAPRWARTAAHGDRRIEIGLVGMDADPAAVRHALSRALVTKAEFECGLWGWHEDVQHERRYWWLLGARAMARAV